MCEVSLPRGWDLQVERGPDWLFIRPHGPKASEALPGDMPPLADCVWSLMEKNFTHRLVLELGDVDLLDSHLVGQLVWLYKRIQAHDGMMRICGLSSRNAEVLRTCRLDDRLPLYRDRTDAVMCASRPALPR